MNIFKVFKRKKGTIEKIETENNYIEVINKDYIEITNKYGTTAKFAILSKNNPNYEKVEELKKLHIEGLLEEKDKIKSHPKYMSKNDIAYMSNIPKSEEYLKLKEILNTITVIEKKRETNYSEAKKRVFYVLTKKDYNSFRDYAINLSEDELQSLTNYTELIMIQEIRRYYKVFIKNKSKG